MTTKIAFAAAALFAACLSTGAHASTVNTVSNGGFEAPALTPSYCYLAATAPTCASSLQDWTGNAVVIHSGSSAWGNQAAQEGEQFVGLQYIAGNNIFGQIAQQQNLPVGLFELTWFDSGRGYYTPGGQATYQVLFDGVLLGTYDTSTNSLWTPRSVTFSLGDGTVGALQFNVVGGTTQDSTAFIDNVQLNLVPEPGSLALAGLALAGALVSRRRKA